MAQTMLEILRARAERISDQGAILIAEHSGMHPVNRPGDEFVVAMGGYYWNALSPAGKRIQACLLPEWDHLSCLLRVLARNLPDAPRRAIDSACQHVKDALAQECRTEWGNPPEALQGFGKALDDAMQVLSDYFGVTPSLAFVIPDTNALLVNPDIESWRFDSTPSFEIVLTPTVLAELDELKVNHRNPTVRRKAEKVIRKIKEYRRRGLLNEGVTIINGSMSLRSIAVEPDMSNTLPWLKAANEDDRFLATTLQIMRENVGHMIFIVTGDINMQNKAEFAGIPFRDPPESSLKVKGTSKNA